MPVNLETARATLLAKKSEIEREQAAGEAMSFLRAGLLDEIKLVVNPVVLGGGTPLFAGGYARRNFRLLSTRPFRSGAMLIDYRPG